MKFKYIALLAVLLSNLAVASNNHTDETAFLGISGYWKGINKDLTVVTGYIDKTGVFRFIGSDGCVSDGRLFNDGSNRLMRYTTTMKECKGLSGEYKGFMTYEDERECRDSELYGKGVIRMDVTLHGVPTDMRLCRTKSYGAEATE